MVVCIGLGSGVRVTSVDKCVKEVVGTFKKGDDYKCKIGRMRIYEVDDNCDVDKLQGKIRAIGCAVISTDIILTVTVINEYTKVHKEGIYALKGLGLTCLEASMTTSKVKFRIKIDRPDVITIIRNNYTRLTSGISGGTLDMWLSIENKY